MGSQILEAIRSGLGLITTLAQEFLSGFGTLFWTPGVGNDPGSLTTFGTFALIMLGISITFSVVVLCINVIRSNTGA